MVARHSFMGSFPSEDAHLLGHGDLEGFPDIRSGLGAPGLQKFVVFFSDRRVPLRPPGRSTKDFSSRRYFKRLIPALRPYTQHSRVEFVPRRLAPWLDTHAHSPAA